MTRHKVIDPKVSLKWGLGEGQGQARAEARILLDFAGHRFT